MLSMALDWIAVSVHALPTRTNERLLVSRARNKRDGAFAIDVGDIGSSSPWPG